MSGPRPKRRRFEFQPGDVVIKILVSTGTAGKIIGTGGAEVKALRAQTGVTLHIWENKFMGTGLQVVVLGGQRACVDQALMFVTEKLMEEAPASGSDAISAQLLLTSNAISKIIGAKGATISQLRQEFGCHLEADKVTHQGEQLLKVNGPGGMVQQLLIKLTEFVEGAGDSQQVANNDYSDYHYGAGAAFVGNVGPWSKGKGPPAKGLFGGKGLGGALAPMASAGKGFGDVGGGHPNHIGQETMQIDLLQAESDPSVLSSVSTIQFAIPSQSVSRVLGKGGVFSKEISRHTGAKLVIDPPGPGAETCVVTLTGQVGGVNRAHCMVVSRLISEY